jgi:hypothetical protein
VYWEKARDYRTSRTMDWLNDACEAKLKSDDRDEGVANYAALMSPVSVAFQQSFHWKHPFGQANRTKLRLGKGRYSGKFPISLLLTTAVIKTSAHQEPRQIQPLLLGTKKWPGKRAAVGRYERATISCDQPQPVADPSPDPVRGVVNHFRCLLQISVVGDIDIRFATASEAQVLFDWLNPKPATAKSGP